VAGEEKRPYKKEGFPGIAPCNTREACVKLVKVPIFSRLGFGQKSRGLSVKSSLHHGVGIFPGGSPTPNLILFVIYLENDRIVPR
jgi:hypothetical protein